MTEKTFYFVHINGAQISKAAKKSKRSHVMKGKNAGKRLQRRSRLQPSPPRPDADEEIKADEEVNADEGAIVLRRDPDKSQQEQNSSDERRTKLVSEATCFGKAVIANVPQGLRVPSMEIMHEYFTRTMTRVYRLQGWYPADEAKRMWLPLVLANQATYYCYITLMQSFNELCSNNGDLSPKAFHYLSQTFHRISRLLAGPDALLDSSIMIIVVLISQELVRKGSAAFNVNVHRNGLEKMIQLRGGIKKLEGNPLLLLKLSKVDIMLSLQSGEAPLFFRDNMAKVRERMALTNSAMVGDAAISCPRHDLLEPTLHGILVDAMWMSSMMNRGAQPDMGTVFEMILSLGYRLAHYHPPEEEPVLWKLQAAYHIGLTIFNMTVFLHAGRHQIMDYELVDRRLKQILDTDIEQHNPKLALWLSILGGLWASDGYDDHWVIQRIRPMAARLDIRSWDEVHAVLEHFPWIHALHDDLSLVLWNQAHQDESIPSWIML